MRGNYTIISVKVVLIFLTRSAELFGFISTTIVLKFWQSLEQIRPFTDLSISVLPFRRSNRDRIRMAGSN